MSEIAGAHFVLIHGISNGAWCWFKIKYLLELAGFKVSCLDLKGCGTDITDPNTILTFPDYNKPLLDFLSSLPENEQVILVGHSAGGLSVSDAIIKFGNKRIKLAIFVAATMLKSGFATQQDIKDGSPDLSEYGTVEEVYDLGFGLGKDKPPTTVVVKKELQRKILYNLSPQEDSTLASILLRPGPIQAILDAKFVYNEDADKVPRIYIRTTSDNVVKPQQQETMINNWPPTDVYVVNNTDHSPFFSAPSLLSDLLRKAAISIGG